MLALHGILQAGGTDLFFPVDGGEVFQLSIMPELALLIRRLARLHTRSDISMMGKCNAFGSAS